MVPTIKLIDAPDPGIARALSGLLLGFNDLRSGYLYDYRPLAVLITDPSNGEVIGGLWGGTSYSYLHVDLLYIPESMRGVGLGTRVLTEAEEEAIQRGCHGVWLDTFSFQARGFYEKLGYSVFGSLEDNPVGHCRFFMKKIFKTASDGE